MTATAVSSHIRLDSRGVAWIEDTNIKLLEIVLDWLAHGSSPEEMRGEYPHLSLAQIHSAMSYYYDHQAEFDAQAKQSLERAEALHAKSTTQPTRAELLPRLKQR